jgi:tRNA(Ile)-lysidine synthase
VAAFAASRCARIAHDPSNLDPRFARARVRADIVPVLAREDPALVSHLCALADEARDAAQRLRSLAEALLGASRQGDGSIDVSDWAAAPPAVRRWALRLWLARVTGAQPGRAQLRAAQRALTAPGEIWLADAWVLRSAGEGRLLLERRPT